MRHIRSQRLVQCRGCSLPEMSCLCAELPSLSVRTRLLVVMQHREAFRTSNTSRVAIKMLSGASCIVRGELGVTPSREVPPGRRLVLFPSEGARELTAADGAGEPLTLIVPDGTWSQAQRVLRREACARGAEVVRLPAPSSTRYSLRRNAREGTVCTLEAIAAAMAILEGPAIEAALLDAFDRFVDRALAVRGRRTHFMEEKITSARSAAAR